MDIIFQGKVATDGSTKIFSASGIIITHIVINNLDSNYIFTLNRFEEGAGIHNVPLYQFELDAGDSINDSEEYTLSASDYLQLMSDVPDTTFYIKGRTQE